MNPWLPEEIFKTWTEAQKRLWETLCAALPFRPPEGVAAWREAYEQNLDHWQAAVQRSLEQETAWVEEWVQRVAVTRAEGAPERIALWTQQMEEVLHRWIATQNQWWNDYFALLRQGGCPPPVPDQGKAPSAAVAPEAPAIPSPTQVLEPPPVPAAADDLKRIKGIGPALEQKLHSCGVYRFCDLAALDVAAIARIEAMIGFPGRIQRENWIGQAQAYCAVPAHS